MPGEIPLQGLWLARPLLRGDFLKARPTCTRGLRLRKEMCPGEDLNLHEIAPTST